MSDKDGSERDSKRITGQENIGKGKGDNYMNRSKMMKTAETIDKFMKAVQGILIVSECLLLIAGICVWIYRNTIAANMAYLTNIISFGNLSLEIAAPAGVVDMELMAKSTTVTAVLFAVLIGIMWYGIRLFRQILEPMKNGEPFNRGVSAILRKLAFFVLIAGILEQIFTMVASRLMMQAYDLAKLINMEVVSHYTMNYSVNLGSTVVGTVVLLLLAYVFHYGEELQRESDETL